MKPHINILLCNLCLAVLFWPLSCLAEVANLSATEDTFINGGRPNNNAGRTSWVSAGRDGTGGVRRGLLRFNLSSIPAGSTVTSAELQMTVTRVPGSSPVNSTFDLFRLLASWSEGDKGGNNGASASTGQATWNDRMRGTASWTTPGAKNNAIATASASTAVTAARNARYSWTGSRMTDDVQLWVDNQSQNFGWLLTSRAESSSRSVRGFASRESSSRGMLMVNYTPPPPPPPPPNGPIPDPAENDDCFNASPVGDVMNLPVDTREATFDGPGLCMTSPNIWYCYTASCTGDVTVSLLGSGFDTKLAAYNGCGCNPTSNNMIECNDDFGSGLQSQVTFTAIAGNLIEIGGFGPATGQGVLTISCEGAVSPQEPDLGDASDSTNNFGRIMGAYPFLPSITAHYPTVFDDGSGVGPYGPVHLNSQVVAYLGKNITSESEADIGPDEDGENNIRPSVNRANGDDGDDGVALPLNLPDCGWATIDYEVTVVTPGTDLWVNVWLDFNRDGDWDDTVDCPGGPAPEWAVQNQYLFNLPTGLNQISTPGFLSWHRLNGPEEIWMRITLAEQPWRGGSNPGDLGNAGSGPQTKYEIGETEDYFFVPDETGGDDCPLCKDVDGNGVIDLQDLIALLGEWLETCP